MRLMNNEKKFFIAQSVLACGNLTYVFAPVPSDSSTLDHAQFLDYKLAGVRRYLKSTMDTCVIQA